MVSRLNFIGARVAFMFSVVRPACTSFMIFVGCWSDHFDEEMFSFATNGGARIASIVQPTSLDRKSRLVVARTGTKGVAIQTLNFLERGNFPG